MGRKNGIANSEITFGGYDPKHFEGEMNFHDVTSHYYWTINAQQLLVDDEDTGICSDDKPCKVAIDSGTSLFTGPSEDLKVLLQHLDKGDGCKDLYNLPAISFVVDGIRYPLLP